MRKEEKTPFKDSLDKKQTPTIQVIGNPSVGTNVKYFDESLHKAYLDKFSDEEKFKAFVSNLNELSNEAHFSAFLATLRKMKLDSQTESNIMTLVALKDI